MFWRAFVPATTKEDLDTLPQWFVSFDGQRFVETTRKPDQQHESSMRVCWQAGVEGPSRRRSRKQQGVFMALTVLRGEIEKIAEIEQVA